MVGMTMGEQDPLEVVLGACQSLPISFEVALDKGKGGALAVVVVAVDKTEATVAGIVRDSTMIESPHLDTDARHASSAIVSPPQLSTSLSGKALLVASIWSSDLTGSSPRSPPAS